MSYRTIDLNQFLAKIERESNTESPIKFTWLIGAGFSASAGIPLAKEVSHILALYEYIGQCKKIEFENEILGFGYDQKQLKNFIDWYYTLKENDSPRYEKLIDETYKWLRTLKHFENITKESPECYQSLFTHLLFDQSDHHYFLTSIIQRVTGINVAHIGLAGILRDFPKWGHTVFTTNFDDLLLKATLSLNNTIRIFGEIKSEEKPSLNPSYPQVVHLHGRHTGYNLLNTGKQISSWFIPKLRESFEEHIGVSNLIVIGYSGWDDLVMQTLSNWDINQLQMIKGNLYWVPFKNEMNIEPKVINFLNGCPELKTFIITNEEKNLNADSFILALTNTINKKSGGFGAYRKDVLQKAKEQHSFIMKQLKEYPDNDPEEILTNLINQTKDCIKFSELERAEKILKSALNVVSQSDITIELKATAGKIIGTLLFKIGNQELAISTLTNSLNYFKSISNAKDDFRVQMAVTHRILAEVLINNNNLHLAYEHIKKSIFESTEINNKEERVDIKVNIILCKIGRVYIHLHSGNFMTVERELKEIQEVIELISNNEKAMGKYLQISGLLHIQKNEIEKAKEFLNNSSNYYKKIDDLRNELLNQIYFACIEMKERRFIIAKEEILRIKDKFYSMADFVGVGICNNLIGYFNSLKDESETIDTETYYKLSINDFEKTNSSYNLINVLTDYYLHKVKVNDLEAAKGLLEKINAVDKKNNKYYKECIK